MHLASELGHWVDLDEAGTGYEPFKPFPIPSEYLKAIEREQRIEPKPKK
jgi:hypothetical protein